MTMTNEGRKLTADELDAYQRRLLAKALAVILSPNWGRKSERPKIGRGEKCDDCK